MAEDAVALHARQVPRAAGAGTRERLAGDLSQATGAPRTGVPGAAGAPTHVVTLVYDGRAVGAVGGPHRWERGGKYIGHQLTKTQGAKDKFANGEALVQLTKLLARDWRGIYTALIYI